MLKRYVSQSRSGEVDEGEKNEPESSEPTLAELAKEQEKDNDDSEFEENIPF